MSLRQYRPKRTAPMTGTDLKGDLPNKIATEQLIPQIAKRAQNAVKVNRTEFYFFQKKQVGRRCSCYSTEQSPDGNCGICFNTGFVGGYDKYGCETEVVDITRPGLRLLNVSGNFDQRTRPVMFLLDEKAKVGIIEIDVDVKANVKKTDLVQVHSSIADRVLSRVKATIIHDGGEEPLDTASFSRALYGRRFTLRITIERDTLAVESPLLSHVFLRYRKIDSPVVIADVPRRRKSIIMQEFGYDDRYEAINLYLADTPRNVATADMFIMLADGTRWKAVDESDNRPGNILTSRDVTCRLVQSYEPYQMVPA